MLERHLRACRFVLSALLVASMFGMFNGGTASAGADFQQCGNITSQAVWGLRAHGVGCDKAKWVAKKYIRVNGGFSAKVKFNKWRCTRSSYGDGVNVTCRKRGPSNDEVRFARGG